LRCNLISQRKGRRKKKLVIVEAGALTGVRKGGKRKATGSPREDQGRARKKSPQMSGDADHGMNERAQSRALQLPQCGGPGLELRSLKGEEAGSWCVAVPSEL
jgi:hypothetical protein